MKKILVKYSEDFGRCGDLDGLFVTTEGILAELKAQGELYIGEEFGKHSEVTALLDDDTLKVVTDDQDFINKLQEVVTGGTDYVSGVDIQGIFCDSRTVDR